MLFDRPWDFSGNRIATIATSCLGDTASLHVMFDVFVVIIQPGMIPDLSF